MAEHEIEITPPADPRTLSHRIGDGVLPALDAYKASGVVQAAIAATLDAPAYGAWLAVLAPVHDALDLSIAQRGDAVAVLAGAVGEFRFQGRFLHADMTRLGVTGRGADPAADDLLAAIKRYAEHEPLKLFGFHFAREGLLNVHRYAARRLAKAFPGGAASLRFLDPHGIGQRPLWARFCRDVDKHRLTEHEREAVVSAANTMLDRLTRISNNAVPVPSAAAAPAPVPVTL